VSILTEPRNALVRQYQKLFEMENCRLYFTEQALRAIVRKAMERDTGARALRSVMENLMLDIMYDLPDQEAGLVYTITPEVINGSQTVIPLREVGKEEKHKDIA